MMAQTSSTKGITCTAFSASLTRALSLLANSAMGSYVGKLLPSNIEDDLRPEDGELVACLK